MEQEEPCGWGRSLLETHLDMDMVAITTLNLTAAADVRCTRVYRSRLACKGSLAPLPTEPHTQAALCPLAVREPAKPERKSGGGDGSTPTLAPVQQQTSSAPPLSSAALEGKTRAKQRGSSRPPPAWQPEMERHEQGEHPAPSTPRMSNRFTRVHTQEKGGGLGDGKEKQG